MQGKPAPEIWETALGELQIQVSKSNYRTWLKKTVGVRYQDDQFVIGVPNTFVAAYLDKNQRSLIEKTLISLTQPDIKVTFQVNGRYHNSSDNHTSQNTSLTNRIADTPRFNAKYTFDYFTTGSSNRLAYAAVMEATQNPGQGYNPLFIYGDSGLGKTHLLHAAGHAALANHSQVLYVSAEQFTNEFINAVQQRKTEEFRHKYRSVDMLLIDDIHFIFGKEQTEESFFHTFNELHNANRQMIITSDRSPKLVSSLTERLRSRFEWGLITDIQPPDPETRVAILQAKASRETVSITPAVLDLIARQNHRNIRELEGCLNRVVAFARLTRTLPTLETATEALRDIASIKPNTANITPGQIIKTVADCFQLTPADLTGRKRDRATALARQLAMYLLREHTLYSLTQIGAELGSRDHSTVLHACAKITGALDTNPYLQHKISEFRQIIQTPPKTRKN